VNFNIVVLWLVIFCNLVGGICYSDWQHNKCFRYASI
jgi:hypothetical protein